MHLCRQCLHLIRKHIFQQIKCRKCLLFSAIRIILLFIDNHPCECCYRVSSYCIRIRNRTTCICWYLSRCCCRNTFRRWFHKFASLIFYRCVGYLLGKSIFRTYITYRILSLLNHASYSRIAFCGLTYSKIHRLTSTIFLRPHLTHFCQIVCEYKCCSRTVRAKHWHNHLCRQFNSRIQCY